VCLLCAVSLATVRRNYQPFLITAFCQHVRFIAPWMFSGPKNTENFPRAGEGLANTDNTGIIASVGISCPCFCLLVFQLLTHVLRPVSINEQQLQCFLNMPNSYIISRRWIYNQSMRTSWWPTAFSFPSSSCVHFLCLICLWESSSTTLTP